jgi:hypothetical protein
MFVTFQDDNLVTEVKDAVRTIAATVSSIDDSVCRLTRESVEIQIRHQCILFGKTICLEGTGVAEFALVILVENHDQLTRYAFPFNQVLIFIGLVCLASSRDIVHAIERGLPTDKAPRAWKGDHARFPMLATM